jgi:hypothetical protein
MTAAPPIIIQRTRAGLEVWLSQNFLIEHLGKSEFALKVNRSEFSLGKAKCYCWKRTNDTYYYAFTSIPKQLLGKLPTREDLIIMASHPAPPTDLTLELEAKQYIADHFGDYVSNYAHRPAQQAINLGRACAMLEWMLSHIEQTEMDTRPMDFFITCCEIIRKLEIRYLPDEAHRNLKAKVLSILDGKSSIIEAVQLRNEGNDYAASHREDREIISWIFTLRASGRNYTNAFIIRKIQQECSKVGKAIPSDRWIGEKMQEHETQYLTAKDRYGYHGKHASRFRRAIPTANALFSGDCWEIDSTKINFVSHRDKDGKTGQYLKIVAVLDVHSGHIAGRGYDIYENRWAYVNALRDAVKNTGYLPCEIRYDRFPGHNTPEFENLLADLRFMGVKTTCVHTAEGKQRIERWFGTMQHVALQESRYYTGEGIMSNRPTAHISEEEREEIKKITRASGWNFDKAVAESERCINGLLATPYSVWSRKLKHINLSPVQMHEQSEKPNAIAVSERQIAYLFGLKKELQIKNQGLIRTTINHEEFIYQIKDHNIIKRYGSVLCCYDVADLSRVHLFAPGKEAMKIYLGEAKEFIPVQNFGPDAERGRMVKVVAMYKELEAERVADLQSKLVANGEPFFSDYEDTVMFPKQVSKHQLELAETYLDRQQESYYNEGEHINHENLQGF